MASSKVLTPELTAELTGKLAMLCSKHERDYLKKKVFLDGRVKSQNKKIPSYIKVLNDGMPISTKEELVRATTTRWLLSQTERCLLLLLICGW